MQKLKNNEARPKFTGSYKKKACNSSLHLTYDYCVQLQKRCSVLNHVLKPVDILDILEKSFKLKKHSKTGNIVNIVHWKKFLYLEMSIKVK